MWSFFRTHLSAPSFGGKFFPIGTHFIGGFGLSCTTQKADTAQGLSPAAVSQQGAKEAEGPNVKGMSLDIGQQDHTDTCCYSHTDHLEP